MFAAPPLSPTFVMRLFSIFFTTFLFFAAPVAAPAAAIPDAGRSPAAPPTVAAKSWLLMEQGSGWIIGAHEPDRIIAPASLTKIMTVFVIFRALSEGDLQLSDEVRVSERAWRTIGSRTFIRVNSMVTVEELLKGVIIQSGNDAAVALAEHFSGTEQAFAAQMNAVAAELGMRNSHFTNSTGLPDAEHHSTVRDLSLLTRRMIADFPDYYRWHREKTFTHNNITQNNRNQLLWQDETIDGVKTGHTESAGYCLIGSAARDGLRFIASVVGAESEQSRARAVRALLRHGYANYRAREIFADGEAVAEAEVLFGAADSLPVGVAGGLRVLAARSKVKNLRTRVHLPDYLEAPLAKGAVVGSVTVTVGGEVFTEEPLVALQDVKAASWFGWMADHVRLWFR